MPAGAEAAAAEVTVERLVVSPPLPRTPSSIVGRIRAKPVIRRMSRRMTKTCVRIRLGYS